MIVKRHDGWWNDSYALIDRYHGQIVSEIKANLDRITLPAIIHGNVHNNLSKYFCKPYSKRNFRFAYDALWEALSHSTKKINELNERIRLVREQEKAWSELKNIFTKRNE